MLDSLSAMFTVMKHLLSFLAPEMRAPGPGLTGWMAQKLMEHGNPPSVREGMKRLDIQPTDVVVELGAGAGVGIQYAHAKNPSRLVAVEISERFLTELENIKAELERTHAGGTNIEIFPDDAKSMPFLLDGSVDKIFAMNVVYFLDPLELYVQEIKRVLKPHGVIVFGCKFVAIKESAAPFINKTPDPIVQCLKNAGFDVSVTAVDLETPMYSYTEIKGIKK